MTFIPPRAEVDVPVWWGHKVSSPLSCTRCFPPSLRPVSQFPSLYLCLVQTGTPLTLSPLSNQQTPYMHAVEGRKFVPFACCLCTTIPARAMQLQRLHH